MNENEIEITHDLKKIKIFLFFISFQTVWFAFFYALPVIVKLDEIIKILKQIAKNTA